MYKKKKFFFSFFFLTKERSELRNVWKILSLDQLFDKCSTTTKTHYLTICFVLHRFSENNFGFVCQRPSIYRDSTRNLVLNSAGFCKVSRNIFFSFFFLNGSWQHGFALLRTVHCAAPWHSSKKNYGRPWSLAYRPDFTIARFAS